MHILETLSERDFTKFDAAGNRNHREAFAHLCYLMDHSDEMKEIAKRNNPEQ